MRLQDLVHARRVNPCALLDLAKIHFSVALPPIMRFVFAERGVLFTIQSHRLGSMPLSRHHCWGKMWWMSILSSKYV